MLKANRFSSDIKARMNSGSIAKGNYRNDGLNLNLETGHYFRQGSAYLAPYLGLTGFVGQSRDYHLSNGMQAHMGAQRSVLAEAGVKLGRNFTLLGRDFQPYANLAVTHELLDNPNVRVNGERFRSDLSGARAELETGFNLALSRSLNLHTDAAYSGGSRVEAPWAVNLGLSFSF